MKKLLLIIILFITAIATKAQLTAGWENAINFGGKGVEMLDLRYTTSGDLYFFATLFGKYEFGGTQYNSAENGYAYGYDHLYGKITAAGQQVLIRRFTAGSIYGAYGDGITDGRILTDGSLAAFKASISYTTSGELAVNYGNGVISQLTGLELLKIDNTGIAQWIKPINPGSNVVYGRSGITSATLHGMQEIGGNIYLIVEANNLNPAGNAYPARVIKFNSSGNESWHFEMKHTSSGITSLGFMPRQFVDSNGEVTFFIMSNKNNLLFNGETLPLETPYSSYYNNWLVHLDANGQKKWSHSTYMGTTFLGVNPQNNEIYFNYVYQKSPAASATFAPFSSLPNLTSATNVYNWRGIIAFDNLGNILRSKVNWPINNYLPKMVIADNGRMLFYGQTDNGQTLRAADNFVYENGVYQAAMEVDMNFEPISVFKTPKLSAVALAGNKFALGATFTTAITFGNTTLTPTHIDGSATKNDILIAQGNLNNIPLTPVVTTWIGSSSDNWNDAANWTNGIPTNTVRAVFSGNPTNMPANIPSSSKAGQIYIPAGTELTLPPGYGLLTVTDKIFNDGKLTVENASSLFNFFGASEVKGNGEFYFKGAASVFSFTGKIANTVSFDNTLQMTGVTVNNLKFIGANAKFKGDVTISNPAENAISGLSATSFVNGTLTRAINPIGNYLFPVSVGSGSSEKGTTVNFTSNSLAGTSTVAVKYTTGTPTGSTANVTANGSTISSVLNGGFFTITPDAQPTSGNYKLALSVTGSNNTVTDAKRYLLIKRNNSSSPWIFQGQHKEIATSIGAGTTAIVNISLEGITSFSDFAVGIGNAPVTLPVKLAKFAAKIESNSVFLTWETLSELNSDRFVVERSTNGNLFLPIGEIKTKGNSNQQINYSLRDKNPQDGMNYYRLKQVDLDGSFEHSEILPIKFALLSTSIKTYPNPASEWLYFKSIVNKKARVNWYNLEGKKVAETSLENDKAKVPSTLNNGLYLVSVLFSDGSQLNQKVAISR